MIIKCKFLINGECTYDINGEKEKILALRAALEAADIAIEYIEAARTIDFFPSAISAMSWQEYYRDYHAAKKKLEEVIK